MRMTRTKTSTAISRVVMTLLKQDVGMALTFIGAMGGDSERLWIPLLIILIGAILFLWGEKR